MGCLALVGYDFPNTVRVRLLAWQITLQLNVSQERLSTRGLLEYEDDTFGRTLLPYSSCRFSETDNCLAKKFRYTTEPLKASPTDLVHTPLLGSEAFHLLAAPDVAETQILELMKLRTQHGFKNRPFIVWEPLPAACTTQNRRSFLQACRLVDVFSPNHLEMSALFEDSPSKGFQPEQLEAYTLEFCKATGMSGNGIVVVRAGEHGSLTTQNKAKTMWLPPYYESSSNKVVDPTGGGNTYLGGFIAGWKATGDIAEASMYGNVAASFAIEQIGLPSCQRVDGEETWNGARVMERLSQYKARLMPSKQSEKYTSGE